MAPTLSTLRIQDVKFTLTPVQAKALYTSAIAILVGALVVPSFLPQRYTLLGLPRLESIFGGLFKKSSREVKVKDSVKQESLEKWIESERAYAWKRLLKNINPPGTDPGCVVASPSKKDPDYWYQWTRDSAMVFKVVIEYWLRDVDTTGKAEKLIMDFITETRKMQHMETPSGGFRTGGLGEVKFNGDGTPFTGSWGRPQNDGPALRASALIRFANALLDNSAFKWEPFVRTELYDGLPPASTESIIKADLDFIVESWNDICFDLWEEVNGLHHFNFLVYIRALKDGADFARRLNDEKSAAVYDETREKVVEALGKFWDEEKGYLLASIQLKNEHGKVDWLDTGTVLGFIHSGDLGTLVGENTEYLGSDKSLMTQHRIATSMRDIYKLNQKHYPTSKGHIGYGIGRYPEDVYDGDGKKKPGYGNPWYLCTLAHAEFYYRLIQYFQNRDISINKSTKLFYMELGYFTSPEEDEILSMAEQNYPVGSKEHSDLLVAFKNKGDAFLSVVKDWARWNGGLWEQFDRNNGGKLGAPNLTWSYASFLSAVAAREGKPMFS